MKKNEYFIVYKRHSGNNKPNYSNTGKVIFRDEYKHSEFVKATSGQGAWEQIYKRETKKDEDVKLEILDIKKI